MRIEKVDVSVIFEFRHELLRKGLALEESKYPNDHETISGHFACFDQNSNVIGCASLLFEPYKNIPDQKAFRLRGMAVAPQMRRAKIGKNLLEHCIEYAKNKNVQIIWCNARTPAVPFYENSGFIKVGSEYELPKIGPHYLMYKIL